MLRSADNAYAAGDYAAAERYAAEAQPVLTGVLSPDNPTLGDVVLMQGQIHTELGRYAEALSELQSALSLYTAAYQAPHPALGDAHYYLADLYLRQEQYEPALAELTEAHAAMASSLGADHPNVGAIIVQRALALHAMGRSSEAAAACAQGLEIIEAGAGEASPMYEAAASQCNEVSRN
jgi:tetratricopeptide (TPR) repeat protein